MTTNHQSRKDSATDQVSHSDELKDWLCGYISDKNFFDKQPPIPLDDLYTALDCAVHDIHQKLDPELEATVHAAGESQHSVNCVGGTDAFWKHRVIDVDGLWLAGLNGIRTMSRERVVRLLYLARDEIQYIDQECRRLSAHCDIARGLKAQKLRNSFEYYPSPRIELPVGSRDLVGAGIRLRDLNAAADTDLLDDEAEEGEIREGEGGDKIERQDNRDTRSERPRPADRAMNLPR